jgi:alpha-tubulin suppressor-like RCC1 family protein
MRYEVFRSTFVVALSLACAACPPEEEHAAPQHGGEAGVDQAEPDGGARDRGGEQDTARGASEEAPGWLAPCAVASVQGSCDGRDEGRSCIEYPEDPTIEVAPNCQAGMARDERYCEIGAAVAACVGSWFGERTIYYDAELAAWRRRTGTCSKWCERPANSADQDAGAADAETTDAGSAADVGAAVAISAGSNHTCALHAGGEVTCWGLGDRGQLGNGSTVSRSQPARVSELGDARAISAGGDATCALRENGEVMCWGHGGAGHLGDGSGANDSTHFVTVPVPVAGLADARAVSVGGAHTCALRDSGAAVCWGAGGSGQLGNGRRGYGIGGLPYHEVVPVEVAGLSDVRAISAGTRHTCALRDSGVWCWGANANPGGAITGQLGNTISTEELTPVAVAGLANVRSISAGSDHTCALRESGEAVCWGRTAWLGTGMTGNQPHTAIAVMTLAEASAISAGASHSCALRAAGEILCWGLGRSGQLGDGAKLYRSTPVAATGVSGATAIAVGGEHSCAITTDGDVICWGLNSSKQLGEMRL